MSTQEKFGAVKAKVMNTLTQFYEDQEVEIAPLSEMSGVEFRDGWHGVFEADQIRAAGAIEEDEAFEKAWKDQNWDDE